MVKEKRKRKEMNGDTRNRNRIQLNYSYSNIFVSEWSHVVNGNGECSNGEVLNGKRGKLSRRDDELIRLIGEHLISIGLEQSANALVKESGTGHHRQL